MNAPVKIRGAEAKYQRLNDASVRLTAMDGMFLGNVVQGPRTHVGRSKWAFQDRWFPTLAQVAQHLLDQAKGRKAKCTRCGMTTPSYMHASLPFFEDCGPGKTDHVCKVCKYHNVAHDKWLREGWPKNMDPHPFEPLLDGREFDYYYCGCGGWD